MDLRTSTRRVAGHHVLALAGTIDLAATPRLHSALRQFVDAAEGAAIAVDLEGVTVLDDAALGLLLGAAAHAREHGRTFRVVCDDDRVRRRLTATRFDRAVAVSRSLSEPVADDIDDVS